MPVLDLFDCTGKVVIVTGAGRGIGREHALAFAAEGHAWTFRLGIPLVSVATAVLLLAAVERPGRLRSTLELPPLTWIGQRSYGIYLWHWPVILIVAQDIPTSAGSAAFVWTRVWAVVVTLALADLSYRFIETPVRRAGLLVRLRRVARLRPRQMVPAGGGATALVLLLVLAFASQPAQSAAQQAIAEAGMAAKSRQFVELGSSVYVRDESTR